MIGTRWCDKFEVGHKQMDMQHEDFFNLIAKLQNAVGHRLQKRELTLQIKAIENFADCHFTFEEQAMTDAGYPGLDEHIEKHHRLLQEFRLKIARFESNDCSPKEIIDFLYDWFFVHIAEEDRKAALFIQNKNRLI